MLYLQINSWNIEKDRRIGWRHWARFVWYFNSWWTPVRESAGPTNGEEEEMALKTTQEVRNISLLKMWEMDTELLCWKNKSCFWMMKLQFLWWLSLFFFLNSCQVVPICTGPSCVLCIVNCFVHCCLCTDKLLRLSLSLLFLHLVMLSVLVSCVLLSVPVSCVMHYELLFVYW